MTWWGWIIAGAILFGAELSFVNAQFYLVFIGAAAILVGAVTALAPLAQWAQWALFAALALLSMPAFRSRLYRRFRRDLPAVATGPVGGTLVLPVALAPGATCQAEHGGAYWTVRNAGDDALPAGARVRVTRVHGLTLDVRPEH